VASYSLEFRNSDLYFKANAFQPALDAPYVQEMVQALHTNHKVCTCGNEEQFSYLLKSVEAHDLPTMADVDSSYIYFCNQVAGNHRVVFTGECADEIFCGYPWYHKANTNANLFPWSNDLSPRTYLLNDNLISSIPFQECVTEAYTDCCSEIGGDSVNTPPELAHQKTFYLTIRYFMQTLINRGDRAASINRMDARMPFAHQELVEYLFNVPYEMQTKDGQPKHLLREYAQGLLPDSVRLRRKSPYPKTYDPGYEAMVNAEFLRRISQPSCPLRALVDPDKASTFCRQLKDLGRPWYGQLMAGPQLVAHYLQILYWLETYHVSLDF
jgi:asparagine synthase (glutamine-hydrolysing)